MFDTLEKTALGNITKAVLTNNVSHNIIDYKVTHSRRHCYFQFKCSTTLHIMEENDEYIMCSLTTVIFGHLPLLLLQTGVEGYWHFFLGDLFKKRSFSDVWYNYQT